MAQSIIVRRRGLAALIPAKYQIIQQSFGGKLKKAKETIDAERKASNNLEDKA